MSQASENSSGIPSENFSESSDKQPMVIKGWKAVVVLGGIIALIGGIFLYPMLTSGKEATMPDLSGQSVTRAISDLKTANFNDTDRIRFKADAGSIVVRQSDWKICEQSPAANEITTRGAYIELGIAKNCSSFNRDFVTNVRIDGQKASGVDIRIG